MPTLGTRRSNIFCKEERLCSKKLIESLFSGDAKAANAYPLRIIVKYFPVEVMPKSAVMISVSKRHFKHAVDRNRTKRQIREAWRLLSPFSKMNIPEGHAAAVGIIWLADTLQPSSRIHRSLKKLIWNC